LEARAMIVTPSAQHALSLADPGRQLATPARVGADLESQLRALGLHRVVRHVAPARIGPDPEERLLRPPVVDVARRQPARTDLDPSPVIAERRTLEPHPQPALELRRLEVRGGAETRSIAEARRPDADPEPRYLG